MNESKANASICRRQIGVASSVSFDGTGYDSLATLDFAVEEKFSPVQLYLDARIVADAELCLVIGEQAHNGGIALLCHAPGLLRSDDAMSQQLVAAAHNVLRYQKEKRVVYHFDERQTIEETVAVVKTLCASGIVPCIENFHQLHGPANARRNYENYLELFRQLNRMGIDARPVVDVPRLFDATLELDTEAASALTVSVVRRLSEMNFLILLHLVDSTKRRMSDRRSWCPVGAGVIPYQEIFASTAEYVRTDDVILEYEDRENPVLSRIFLQQVLGAVD